MCISLSSRVSSPKTVLLARFGDSSSIMQPCLPPALPFSCNTICALKPKICFLLAQHAIKQQNVSQGEICFDKFMCRHTTIDAADQTCYFSQSLSTGTVCTSFRTDPITPCAWQRSHRSTNIYMQIRLAISFSHRVLALGQPVLEQIL